MVLESLQKVRSTFVHCDSFVFSSSREHSYLLLVYSIIFKMVHVLVHHFALLYRYYRCFYFCTIGVHDLGYSNVGRRIQGHVMGFHMPACNPDKPMRPIWRPQALKLKPRPET